MFRNLTKIDFFSYRGNAVFIVNSYNVIVYDNDRQTLHPDKQAKYTGPYSWIHHCIPFSIAYRILLVNICNR